MNKESKYKICRRLGNGVFEKCQSQKFILSEQKRKELKKGKRKQVTDYGFQLMEKQKVRLSYGLKERQLSTYVGKAMLQKGSNVDKLFEALETRLDNVVYRLGFAETRAKARQVVSHGHITVNGKKLNIPSYAVSMNDVIGIRPQSVNKALFEGFDDKIKNVTIPAWLSFDIKKKEGTVVGTPKFGANEAFNLKLVFEFYSR